MKKFFAMALVGLMASSAFAGFTSGPHNGINSGGPVGAAANSPAIVHANGAGFIPGSVTVSGTLTEVNTGTFATEARFRVTSAGGDIYNTAAHIGTGNYTTSINVPANTQTLPAAFTTNGPGNSVGNWSFQPFESFDDGGPDSVDQTWTNLNISVNDWVDPRPSNAVDLGDFVIDGRNKAYGTIDPANQVDWYTITIGEAQEIRFSTSKTLSLIDDGVAIADTEIGIYSNSGALLASNDDISFPTNPYSLVTFPNLAAGTYYVAVAGYNTTFGASNWAVSSDGQSGIGDYWLNITPEPASLALLALGGLVIARRRR